VRLAFEKFADRKWRNLLNIAAAEPNEEWGAQEMQFKK
jgi:hypothetical protein